MEIDCSCIKNKQWIIAGFVAAPLICCRIFFWQRGFWQHLTSTMFSSLLPLVLVEMCRECGVFLKTTVSRANDSGNLKYYTTARLVRRDGKPTHESVHYLGALTYGEAEGIRNALRAAKNSGSIFVDLSTISAEKPYDSCT